MRQLETLLAIFSFYGKDSNFTSTHYTKAHRDFFFTYYWILPQSDLFIFLLKKYNAGNFSDDIQKRFVKLCWSLERLLNDCELRAKAFIARERLEEFRINVKKFKTDVLPLIQKEMANSFVELNSTGSFKLPNGDNEFHAAIRQGDDFLKGLRRVESKQFVSNNYHVTPDMLTQCYPKYDAKTGKPLRIKPVQIDLKDLTEYPGAQKLLLILMQEYFSMHSKTLITSKEMFALEATVSLQVDEDKEKVKIRKKILYYSLTPGQTIVKDKSSLRDSGWYNFKIFFNHTRDHKTLNDEADLKIYEGKGELKIEQKSIKISTDPSQAEQQILKNLLQELQEVFNNTEKSEQEQICRVILLLTELGEFLHAYPAVKIESLYEFYELNDFANAIIDKLNLALNDLLNDLKEIPMGQTDIIKASVLIRLNLALSTLTDLSTVTINPPEINKISKYDIQEFILRDLIPHSSSRRQINQKIEDCELSVLLKNEERGKIKDLMSNLRTQTRDYFSNPKKDPAARKQLIDDSLSEIRKVEKTLPWHIVNLVINIPLSIMHEIGKTTYFRYLFGTALFAHKPQRGHPHFTPTEKALKSIPIPPEKEENDPSESCVWN